MVAVRRPPRVLSIAGSDSSGGAGIQADLKTFAAHGVYGATVVTAVTAQHTRGVDAVHVLPVELVVAQFDAVVSDIGFEAVKIGMLASVELVRAVAAAITRHRLPNVVLDPVMVATSGDRLLTQDAEQALRDELLPVADLVTPNLPEAARLSGLSVDEEAQCLAAARVIAQAGPAVLLKGGHGRGSVVRDLLLVENQELHFEHPRLPSRSTHGTGCTLSAAIAARLAAGQGMDRAVAGALDYLHGAIAAAYPIGKGRGPVHHLHAGSPIFSLEIDNHE